jgi:hypothetical protein
VFGRVVGLLLAMLLVGGVWLLRQGGDDLGGNAPPPGGPVTEKPGDGHRPPPTDQEVAAALKSRANQVVALMKAQDLTKLATFVHPTKGVRFTPYLHVGETDRLYQASALAGAMADQTVHHWGQFDGSGEPMDLTFQAYWNRFVWNRDYTTAPQVAVDQRLGKGNMLDNTAQAYPGARWVEYHFPGTEQYGGMDWTSLRLVFAEESGTWYLVGVSHDQWTI